MLSDSSDDEGGVQDVQLTINEHYAKAFEYRKEREELAKLKEKYGSSYASSASSLSSTDSESAESEDEDGEELTAAVDAAILRTLARIRKKDPAIYESGKDIFGEETEKVANSSTKKSSEPGKKAKDKSKPVTLRQAALSAVLNPSRTPSPEPAPHTHVEEQRKLRNETIAAFHGAIAPKDDEEEEDEDDLLIPREKTKDEREAEEEEYRAFLERQVGDLRDLVSVDGDVEEEVQGVEEAKEAEVPTDKKKKKKKSKKAKGDEPSPPRKSKTEKDQEFLMNYILNRGWIDRSSNHVPTYGEITSPAEQKQKELKKPKKDKKAEIEEAELFNDANASTPKHPTSEDEEDAALLSDASFESLASHFEASYNHRFEEPNAAHIPSFPRSLPSLVRRQDTTRKDARERRKQRKEEEMQKKREEVRRMKALKMREVKRKLERIGREGGLGEGDGGVDEALRELDLEGEWDAERHDQQMRGLFAGGREDGEGEAEEEEWVADDVALDGDGKPVWSDDIDIGDIPVSDDDAFPVARKSKKELKKEKKKKEKKKKKKKSEEDEDEDGVDLDAMDADVDRGDDDEEWDGTEEMRKRKLDEYMNEIYGLDFNDMVGDLPTRFKYVPVPQQTYSLTPVEILLATDKELNEYVSVKKYAPYRQEKDRSRWDKNQQEKLREFKEKVGERVGLRGTGGNEGGGEKVKKRKGKKERMKMKAAVVAVDVEVDAVGEEKTGEKRKRDDEEEVENGEAGEVKKKKRRRHRTKGEFELS